MPFFQTLVSLDVSVLNAMRSWVDPQVLWQVKLVHLLADSEVIAVALFLVGLWLYGRFVAGDAYRRAALHVFYGIAVSFCCYVLLNLGLPVRPRPETVTAIRPLIDHLPDNSFPSGHAIFSTASVLATALFLPARRLAWAVSFAVLALAMNAARVVAGVHYPGDILAGFVVGTVGPLVVLAASGKAWFERVLVVPIIRLAAFVRL